MTGPVVTTHRVRYLETDSQHVVFNMWYLGYCDEAYADFLEGTGVPYPTLLTEGYDVQVVRADLEWQSSLKPRDIATLTTSCAHIGTTSFTLETRITTEGSPVATVRIVYVGVARNGSGTRPIPAPLREALEGASRGAAATS